MTTQSTPEIAIIVLTWNQCDFTLGCLTSLAEMDYPSERLQVIVVDNGSHDGTADAVRQRFPTVTVIENSENLGFAAGNNVGIRAALAGGAKYIMLLNNDTVVELQLLSKLVAVLDRNPRAGVVGPKMLYFEPPDVVWCAGNRINWATGATDRCGAEQRDSETDEPLQEADFITACAVMLRREVIEQIGLLDPRFFIYYEETDWCVRAHRAGWQILYCPQARIWHKVSAAMGTTSPATDYYYNRNRLLFLAKNLSGLRRALVIGRSAVRELMVIASYTAKPQGGARRRNRDVRVLALRDALLGRWGKMGEDVAAVCRHS